MARSFWPFCGGGKDPALAPMQQGSGEVVAGALTAMAPGMFAPRAILGGAPLANGVALAARTLQRTILPPAHTAIRLALLGVEEVVHMGAHRHG